MNRVYLQREGKIRRGRKASAGIKRCSLLAEGTQGQPEGAAYFKKLICRRTNCLWYLAIPGEEGSGGEGRGEFNLDDLSFCSTRERGGNLALVGDEAGRRGHTKLRLG